jgi:hypothetical protein
MLLCVWCGFRLGQAHAFDAFAATCIRLTRCRDCGRVADPYVERQPLLVALDLVLHRPPVYRHLLFNVDIDDDSGGDGGHDGGVGGGVGGVGGGGSVGGDAGDVDDDVVDGVGAVKSPLPPRRRWRPLRLTPGRCLLFKKLTTNANVIL